MKSREIGIGAIALGLGFWAGTLNGKKNHGPQNQSSQDHPTPSIRIRSTLRSSTADPGSDIRESPRLSRTTRDNKAAGPRVSIPLSTVAGLLKQELSYSDFLTLGRKMEDALAMLGTTEQEKKDVMMAINSNQAALLAAEQSHVKVAMVDASRITLDLAGMEEPAGKIAAQLQSDLRAALPQDLAEALVSSIDVERYYFSGKQRETSFHITRNDGGGLMATRATGGGSTGTGIQSEKFADDGSSIPATEVFDKRWSKWLEGQQLQPPPPP